MESAISELICSFLNQPSQELSYRNRKSLKKSPRGPNSQGKRFPVYSLSQADLSPFYNTRVDKLGKNCKRRNHSIAFVLLLSSTVTVHEVRENLFPGMKIEI